MTTSVGRNSSSTATPTKATFSYWLKGQHDGTQQGIWGWHRGNDSSNYWLGVYYSTNGSMYFNWKQGSFSATLGTTQKFRDPCAWGHHVISIDTTLSTASDRVKWYINGQRVTSFEDGLDTISQNTTILNWSNSQDKMEIGTWYQASSAKNLNNHLISHFHMTDAYAYQASDFGSTDSVTGEWKINTSPSVTYGSEGGFWFKDDAALTDRSGQGNNFTLDGGTLTKTEDCPSNVFATLNPLSPQVASQMSAPPTNGNTTLVSGSGSAWGTLISTIGATTGKYYFEAKCIANGSNCIVGAVDINDTRSNGSAEWYIGQSSTGQGYQNNGAAANGGASYGATYTNGDIIGVAMDLDNSKIYFHKNGTYQNSGVPTSGSTGTGAMSLTAGTTYAFALTGYASTTWYSNFGNGYFSTGAISSEGTNASGIGKFEYDVPTGYTALSTKGLNL